jgi:hypothetical protein
VSGFEAVGVVVAAESNSAVLVGDGAGLVVGGSGKGSRFPAQALQARETNTSMKIRSLRAL